MRDQASVIQTYKNIADLLQVGQFPGSVSKYLVESQLFIQRIIKAIEDEQASKDGTVTEDAGHSGGNSQKSGGMDDSGVPNTRRKSRKRNSKPA